MSTYAWAWAHVQEQNRELLRQQILKTFKNEQIYIIFIHSKVQVKITEN